ncbi:hypothetical protein BJF78_33415 [Pseudonocardia sp. CNS-139]|nr:hypothetical protein BJF78_33415 [Pseudonocardia sp. CNS-139]
MRFAAGSAAVTGGRQTVSLEEAGALRDADAILYYTNADGSPANLGPALFAQPAFQALPAVAGGRLFGTTFFLPSSYTSAFGLLDDLDTALRRLA